MIVPEYAGVYDKTKPAGTMFPYCPHCGHILTDYHPISGVTKP